MSLLQKGHVMNHIAQTSNFTKPTSKTDRRVTTTKRAATQLVDGTVNAASRLADDAKDEIGRRLTSEKARAVGAVETIAGAMRHTADELEELGPLPDMVERAADGIERAADFVQTRSLSELLVEVESYARREPAVFLGGAFVLGLFGARLMKSSTSRPIEGEANAEFGSQGMLPPPNPPPRPASYRQGAYPADDSHPSGDELTAMPDEEHAAISSPPPPFVEMGAVPKPYPTASGYSSSKTNTPGLSSKTNTPGLGVTNGGKSGAPGEPGGDPIFDLEGP
jgi:hypothetical protein